jgi:uncharacterized protein (TIGR02646 family)
MMKIERPNAPDWLNKHWEAWGKEYATKLGKNPKYKFSWKSYKKEKVNHKLLPLLLKMTANHCSFCDGFPIGEGVIKETIEHFWPKASGKFPERAYLWSNLFVACHYCQEKGDDFDDRLLKPDMDDYDFNKYFIFNFRSFEIEVRKDTGISKADRMRAETTIKMYKLNYSGRSKAREREFKHYANKEGGDQFDDFSYRYMFL